MIKVGVWISTDRAAPRLRGHQLGITQALRCRAVAISGDRDLLGCSRPRLPSLSRARETRSDSRPTSRRRRPTRPSYGLARATPIDTALHLLLAAFLLRSRRRRRYPMGDGLDVETARQAAEMARPAASDARCDEGVGDLVRRVADEQRR